MASSPILTRGDYTVGWICALSTELTAACAMLDQRHEPLDQSRQDENNYILGRIGVHNVVLACLPAGIAGLTSAATIAVQMRSSFKRIRIGLMVGIGGGVPSHDHDIRLGDIVVSKPSGTSGGVIQYDFGKTVQYGRFTRTGSLNRPPDMLLTAISNLQAKHGMKDLELTKYLTDMVIKHPKMASEFRHLGQEKDHLYEGNYAHPGNNTTCSACDISKLVKRKPRHSNVPAIHYGLIASANQLMKDGATRDILRQDLDILCFEMEAAGLMDGFPCIVIRGICDYADSHKNKQWQPWAAAVAAAYAKELLSVISRQQVANKNPVIKVAGQGTSISSYLWIEQIPRKTELDRSLLDTENPFPKTSDCKKAVYRRSDCDLPATLHRLLSFSTVRVHLCQDNIIGALQSFSARFQLYPLS